MVALAGTSAVAMYTLERTMRVKWRVVSPNAPFLIVARVQLRRGYVTQHLSATCATARAAEPHWPLAGHRIARRLGQLIPGALISIDADL